MNEIKPCTLYENVWELVILISNLKGKNHELKNKLLQTTMMKNRAFGLNKKVHSISIFEFINSKKYPILHDGQQKHNQSSNS